MQLVFPVTKIICMMRKHILVFFSGLNEICKTIIRHIILIKSKSDLNLIVSSTSSFLFLFPFKDLCKDFLRRIQLRELQLAGLCTHGFNFFWIVFWLAVCKSSCYYIKFQKKHSLSFLYTLTMLEPICSKILDKFFVSRISSSGFSSISCPGA